MGTFQMITPQNCAFTSMSNQLSSKEISATTFSSFRIIFSQVQCTAMSSMKGNTELVLSNDYL